MQPLNSISSFLQEDLIVGPDSTAELFNIDEWLAPDFSSAAIEIVQRSKELNSLLLSEGKLVINSISVGQFEELKNYTSDPERYQRDYSLSEPEIQVLIKLLRKVIFSKTKKDFLTKKIKPIKKIAEKTFPELFIPEIPPSKTPPKRAAPKQAEKQYCPPIGSRPIELVNTLTFGPTSGTTELSSKDLKVLYDYVSDKETYSTTYQLNPTEQHSLDVIIFRAEQWFAKTKSSSQERRVVAIQQILSCLKQEPPSEQPEKRVKFTLPDTEGQNDWGDIFNNDKELLT